MNLYDKLPNPNDLKKLSKDQPFKVYNVNGHFHTPYSFSAFTELEEVFKMAVDENVDVLGINDFFTTAGYDEFASLCLKHRKFPLFNIEFMGLLKEEQKNDIRVNDPSNPGRTYFSGKGLDYPFRMEGAMLEKLKSIRKESDLQTRQMVEKAAAHMASINPAYKLSYDEIKDRYTKGMVRERHIAKAIRVLVYNIHKDAEARKVALMEIYGGQPSQVNSDDHAAVEGEIRSKLLKSGGVAYVKEDPKAFLEISEISEIIIAAGGIPCYPVLLDDKNGDYTDFEADKERLFKRLTELKVFSIELIPGRNSYKHLKPFVEYFREKGFVVTFGTEHNTPALDPLTVSVGDGPLDKDLKRVSYEGACVIAAHQYLRANGETGFVNSEGIPSPAINEFITLGNTVINSFINLK